ncbi:D-alanyl-D-alanine carboxypeptidase family protein [Gordonia polyisoprenivorans]|uniref:D-alanyl-D-alanine carboxypeptidase family protein n=1 Tax=Gordonia polyisoprenivorans TaxID=84595 RepID=UPI001AD7C39F|nr:serine hydrolase [Gordonia polyisoprenivorans]QTI71172.1 D-alanyl-D-alanine carboxypeptidase [Gordonia polyisoprenivorans]
MTWGNTHLGRRIGAVRIGAVLTAVCAAALVSAPGAAVAVPPVTTPITDQCPHRQAPPPPVDTSEVVAPGSTTPTALPIPTPTVGGERLSACGVIADPGAGPIPERLTSAAWLVADMDTGAIIAAKDPHGRYRPASTIKVLLALTVLDAGLNLDKTVVPTAEDWSQEGDSCGMGPGGHYTVRDMLSGLLIVSGNDCAHALARELGGVASTLTKMNSLAADLHALDTRAATPSGLDAAGMSTSPYDLALIFRAAMNNSTFRDIISTPTYHFPGYPPRSDVTSDTPHPGYEMQTSDQLLLQGYPGMLGGKTGYTDDALKTFVGAARHGDKTILIVQMYGLSTADDNYWTQAQSLLEYGFHAPADIRVGELIAGPNTSAPAATTASSGSSAETTQAGAARPANTVDHSTATRVLVGLVVALVVVILLAAATRITGRRRR